MRPPVLTFFNNKGGVGKTSLVYHLAWMYAKLGKRVVVADFDPQANLTAAFLDENTIENLWTDGHAGSTIYQSIKPLTGVGDIAEPQLEKIDTNLFLIPGDVELSNYEDILSTEWPQSMNDRNLYRPLRILSAFWQVIQMAENKLAGTEMAVDIVLIDIGPNLGAINRSALLATDYVVIPLGADLFSLQGLKNLGPTLREWRINWKKRLNNWSNSSEKPDHPRFMLPSGSMRPIGYLCQQYGIHLNRPVKAYDKWVRRFPRMYRKSVLNKDEKKDIALENDPYCLATMKHYRSLVPMAQEHRKPLFMLTSADGAIGGHANAVTSAYNDFQQLAKTISHKMT